MQGFIIPLSRSLGARIKNSSRSLTLLVYPPPPTTPAALRCCAHRFPAGFVPLGQKPFDVFMGGRTPSPPSSTGIRRSRRGTSAWRTLGPKPVGGGAARHLRCEGARHGPV